jgi:hypothetical protein
MNVSFRCARCGHSNQVELDRALQQIGCSACDQSWAVPPQAIGDGQLGRCVVCPCTELFVRKDFPRFLGVSIIAAGIVASTIAWAMYRPITTFAILGATALLDLVVYGLVGDVLECYRCHAEYRAVNVQSHAAFEMTTYEAQRQHVARLAQHARQAVNEGPAE